MRRLSISEVCNLLDVKPHVLRYWERQVSLLQPAKTAAGRREYSMRDVELLFRLKYLLTERKFTLDGAVQKLIEESSGERGNAKASLQELRTGLLDTRRRLGELKRRLASLDPRAGIDPEALRWLAGRPASDFDPREARPFTRLSEIHADASSDPPAASSGSGPPDVVSLAPNWNISPEESPLLVPLAAAGQRSPLEIVARSVRRLLDGGNAEGRWTILVPHRSARVLRSALVAADYFGLRARQVSLVPLPDLAPPGGEGVYSSPGAALWAGLAVGRILLAGVAPELLWLPLETPLEEPNLDALRTRARRGQADIVAMAWERPRPSVPGDHVDGHRLVPTGVMLVRRASLPELSEGLRVRYLRLDRDIIFSGASADQENRQGGPHAYIGVPELLAAAPRRGIVARKGRSPQFIRTRRDTLHPTE